MSWIACDRPIKDSEIPKEGEFSLPRRERLLLAWGLFFASLIVPFLCFCVINLLCCHNRHTKDDPEWNEKLEEAKVTYQMRLKELERNGQLVRNSEASSGDDINQYAGDNEVFKKECLAPLDETPPRSPVTLEMVRIERSLRQNV